MRSHLKREPDHERGATAVEYALLVSFIAAVIISIVTTLGLKLGPLFNVNF